MSQLLASTIALAVAFAAPRGPHAPPGDPVMPVAQTAAGVRAEVTGIYAGVTILPEDSPRGWVWSRHLDLSVRISSPEDGRFSQPLTPVLDECTDERGAPVKFAEPRDTELSRNALAGAMRSMANSSGERSAYTTAQAFGLRRVPARLTSLRAHVNVLVAGTVAEKELAPECMADYAEIAPGAKFLLSRFENGPKGCWIDYEVRLARRGGEGPATLEDPVFIGLELRSASGERIHVIAPTQELETRDEIIAVARDVQLPAEWCGQTASLRAVVATDIKAVRFDFAADNVPLATPD